MLLSVVYDSVIIAIIVIIYNCSLISDFVSNKDIYKVNTTRVQLYISPRRGDVPSELDVFWAHPCVWLRFYYRDFSTNW